MAGSISLSLSQQFNELGKPLAGGLLYFYAAGTTTPQDAFKDSNLTLQHPNPITLDAAGRVPAFYLADGNIKIRLTDAAGVTQIAADNLLVIGPSSGSGSGDTVDATTILATGDIKVRYGTGSLSGFVRLNGRTIGSSTSGASELANASAQALFEFLWTNDASLAVSTGRGANANADWVANKQLTLPDFRGRALAGLDDMGNAAAGRLTATYFGAVATTLGAVGGSESHTITAAQSAALTYTATSTDAGHVHAMHVDGPVVPSGTPVYAVANNINTAGGGKAVSIGSTDSGTASITTTVSTNAGGVAHNNTQPTALITVYCKL